MDFPKDFQDFMMNLVHDIKFKEKNNPMAFNCAIENEDINIKEVKFRQDPLRFIMGYCFFFLLSLIVSMFLCYLPLVYSTYILTNKKKNAFFIYGEEKQSLHEYSSFYRWGESKAFVKNL